MCEELFVRRVPNADCPRCVKANGHLFNGLCIDCQPATRERRHESDGAKLGATPTDRGSKC